MTNLINFFKKPYVSLKPYEFLEEKNDFIKLTNIDNECFGDLHPELKILESLSIWDNPDFDPLDYNIEHNKIKESIDSSGADILLLEKAVEYINQLDKNIKPSTDLKKAFKKITKVFLFQMKTKSWIGPPIDFSNNLEAINMISEHLNFLKLKAEIDEITFKYLNKKELLSNRKKYKAALKELHIKLKEQYKEYYEIKSNKKKDIIYNNISKEQLLYGLSSLWKDKKFWIEVALNNLKEIEPENYQKAFNAFKEVCVKYDKYLT